MQIIKGRQKKPRRVLLYGQEGVGKSTWASKAPRPIFLDFEDGLGDLDVEKSPRLASYQETLKALGWLYESDHEYQSVVFDTVDWFERLLFAQVCAAHQVDSIEKVEKGFGKGYTIAAELLQSFLQSLEALVHHRKMNVVILGHCTKVKQSNPEQDSYDQFAPDLNKQCAAVLREWCDEVFFASHRTFTRSTDEGFNRTRTIAIDGNERFIRTTHSAGVQAKNRLSLPAELPMDWAAYQAYWPSGGNVSPTAEAAGNVAGIVVNGSSKRSA